MSWIVSGNLITSVAHGETLNRIEVISYGETKPAVDNKTAAHRAQNRRVVISVLE